MSEFLQLQPIAKKQPGKNRPWQILFEISRKYYFHLLLSLTSTAISAMMYPAAAIICGRMFGSLNQYNSGSISSPQMSEDISILCFSLAILGCLSWIIECGFMSSWIVYGEGQAMKTRRRLFKALVNKDMAWYDLREDGIGSLLVRFETLVKEFQFGLSQPLGFVVYEIFGSSISLVVAFFRSWQLTLLLLGILPLMAIALWYLSTALKSAVHKQHLYLGHASKHVCASIKASCIVKVYNTQNYESRQYKKCLKLVTRYYMIQARLNALQLALMKLIIKLCFLGGFWLGLYLVIHGKDSGSVITAFYTALSVIQSIEIISAQSIYIVKGISARHVLDSLSAEPQSSQRNRISYDTDRLRTSESDIEFKRVSFSYPKNHRQNVINDVNLIFPAGKTTYIVGRSGSGKSTIGGLLLNFYTADKGDVMIGGISIQNFTRNWLRKNITLVDQEVPLFNETIFQNIALGLNDFVSSKEVMNAGNVVDLESMIRSLPHGLNTMISQSGRSLSGGQRQKVAITRARLRDSPILILDEATSGLDQNSCYSVNSQIRKWRQGKTTIIITHDVSQILDDEYIYVIDKGFVIEEGFRKNLVLKEDGALSSFLTESPEIRTKLTSNLFTKKAPYLKPTVSNLDLNNSRSKISCQKLQIVNANRETLFDSYTGFNEKLVDTVNMDSNPLLDSDEQYIFQEPNQNGGRRFLDSRPGLATRLSRWWKERILRKKIYFLVSNTDQRRTFALNSNDYSKNQVHLHPGNAENFSPNKNQSCIESGIDQIKPSTESFKNIFSSIWPRLSRKKKKDFIIGIIACFITSMTTPLFAYFISNLMKLYDSTSNQLKEGSVWAIALLWVATIDSICSYCSHYYLERVGQAWITSLRAECLQIILGQPKTWLDKEANSPSMLSQYLDRDAEEMRNLVGRFFGQVLTSFWMSGISIIWALTINWRLAVVALSCAPAIYLSSFVFNWTSKTFEDKCNIMAGNISKISTEALTNIRTVRAIGLESYFQKKHKTALSLAYAMGLRRSLYTGVTYGFLSGTLTFFMIGLVVYYGTALIIDKKLSVFGCFEIINLLLFGLGHSLTTISLIPQINSSRLASTKILSLKKLSLAQSFETKRNKRLNTIFPIIMKDLNFTYPKCVNATLREINLTINHSSFTVITGSSGSGKSTIASILLGLYPPDYSHIPSLSFAGTRIEECHMATVRHLIGFVPQDPILFPGTIYANIIYGLTENSKYLNINAVRYVARRAGIIEFIDSLQEGFYTKIGDGGLMISRGQAKRITVARALIHHPKLLIMDEPTSGLDSCSASCIRNTVQEIRRHSNDTAIIIITHSIEMMAISDNVIVLKHGEIIERGEFHSLWNNNCSWLWKITRGESVDI